MGLPQSNRNLIRFAKTKFVPANPVEESSCSPNNRKIQLTNIVIVRSRMCGTTFLALVIIAYPALQTNHADLWVRLTDPDIVLLNMLWYTISYTLILQ